MLSALKLIKKQFRVPPIEALAHLMVLLPEPDLPESNTITLIPIEKKTLIFDMDETLVHCVNDLHADRPDLVLSIYFPDENETVNVIALLSSFRPASTCVPTFSIAWKRPTSSSRSASLRPPIRPTQMPSWTTLIPLGTCSASGSTETPACGPQTATM